MNISQVTNTQEAISFLQALMFDPNFIAGMNLNEMKEVFPIAYSDSHNRFYKKLQKEIIE